MGRVKPSAFSKVSAPVRNFFAAQMAKAAWLWLSPMFGGAAGLVAWGEGLSPTAVLLSVLIAAAMVTVLLNQGRSYLSASSPKGKIALSIGAELRVNFETQDHVGYALTAYFSNSADFPIEVEIVDFGATIQGHTIDHLRPKDQIWVVPPRASIFLDYGLIPYVAPDFVVTSPILGTMRITYDYGRTGKAGYKEIQVYRLVIYVDEYGQVLRTDPYLIREDK